MLFTIETTNRKSILVTEYWFSDKSGFPKDELTEIGFTEEEYKNLPDTLKMTSETSYRWGEMSVDMSEKDFKEMDWENNDVWNPSHHECEVEDHTFSDGSINDIDFNCDIGEGVDSYDMYDLILNYGDLECDTNLIGSLTATKI